MSIYNNFNRSSNQKKMKEVANSPTTQDAHSKETDKSQYLSKKIDKLRRQFVKRA